MARKLSATVILDDVTYPAYTSPPADVAEWITNPAAWLPDDPVDAEPAPEPAKRAPRKAAKKAAGKRAEAKADENSGGDTPAEGVPAADAGDQAWRDYAATVGVTVAEDADTAAVKAELDERGLLEQ